MANVLVTGAAGFIGSHLTQRCLEKRHRVLGIDSFNSHGSTIMVSTLVHDPVISQHRIDSNPSVAERWRSLLIECGAMRAIPLGHGEVPTVRLRRIMTELERLVSRRAHE
jgi:nucleoside-diphosphate-sugar epimerase